MADRSDRTTEMSNIAASGFRMPSAQAITTSTRKAMEDANATGRAFLEKMAPPRSRSRPSTAHVVAPTLTIPRAARNRGTDMTEENKKPSSSIQPLQSLPWGSIPSIPSSITHPTFNSYQEEFTSTRQARRRALRPNALTGRKIEPALPDSPDKKDNSTPGSSISGCTTSRGYTAFTTLANLDMFTPSMTLELKYQDGKVTCTFSGFPSSHCFDDALQSRVEANMKALEQDLLGQSVNLQLLIKKAVSIAHLKSPGGNNTAVVESRLVQVVMDLFDYVRVDDVVVHQRETKEGLVEVVLDGLKWKSWNTMSMNAAKGFKKAFPGDGKMTAQEQKYYNDMPMLGLEGVFNSEDEGVLSSLPVNREDNNNNNMPARKILVPFSQKGHHIPASSRSKREAIQSDEPTLRYSSVEDDITTINTAINASSPANHAIHSPILDTQPTRRLSVTFAVPELHILKSARDSNNWLGIKASSIRAFLDEEGEHQNLNVGKVQLVRVATEILNRKYPPDGEEDDDQETEDDDDEQEMEDDNKEMEDEEVLVEKRPKIVLKLKNPFFKRKREE